MVPDQMHLHQSALEFSEFTSLRISNFEGYDANTRDARREVRELEMESSVLPTAWEAFQGGMFTQPTFERKCIVIIRKDRMGIIERTEGDAKTKKETFRTWEHLSL